MSTTAYTFVPAFQYISDITNAEECVVTFTADHTYTVGEILSFRVSSPYGMFQLNNQTGLVLAVTSTTVTMDIDTRNYSAFVTPVTAGQYPALAVPAGSGVIPGAIPPHTTIYDHFDNVPST